MTSFVRRRGTLELIAIIVAVAAGVVLAVARPSLSFGASDPAAAEATLVARRHVDLLVNMGSANAAKTLKDLGKQATGAWADQLKADPEAIVGALKKTSASTNGRVDSVAVSAETNDTVTVLVAASALVSNSAGSKNVTRAYYFILTLVRADGGWRVTSLETAT